jgi:glycosyltransferase involved in cell wall biosynthesis
MGIPCIVSDINGSNEIIKNGNNGLIVPLKDVETLHQKMSLLLENPNQITWSETIIREAITSRFERKVFWNLLLEEYKKLSSYV